MRTLLLGDIGNRLDIEDTEKSVSTLQHRQKRAERKQNADGQQIQQLKDEVGRQKLAIQALTRFLVEKEFIDESELEEFIAAVDAEDGVIDGKPRLIFATKKIPPGTFKSLS